MQPPRDPILRAVWKVCQADDLTEQEKIAMLALWRMLGGERKAIGPGLLALLLGTTRARAKNILTSLRRKGYIGCRGRVSAGRGHCAERWLTAKLQLPKAKKRAPGDTLSAEIKGYQAVPRKGYQAVPLTKGSDMGRPLGSGRTQGRPSGSEEEKGTEKLLRIAEHWPDHEHQFAAAAGGPAE